jgi:hypothetical protein
VTAQIGSVCAMHNGVCNAPRQILSCAVGVCEYKRAVGARVGVVWMLVHSVSPHRGSSSTAACGNHYVTIAMLPLPLPTPTPPPHGAGMLGRRWGGGYLALFQCYRPAGRVQIETVGTQHPL